MRRKIRIIILSLLAVVVMIPAVVFAEPPAGGCASDPSGRHDWVRGENIKDPTCTETGTVSYTCRHCGQQYTEEIPPAHTIEIIYGRAATCTTSGLSNGQKCSVCDKVLVSQYILPALGHNYVSSASGEPTCTETGFITYTCTRCGNSYTEEVPASWHDWDDGVVTAEPEGFVPGVRTFTCKRDSSHTMTEEINPGPALFNKVRGIAADAAELTVAKQPEGGSIKNDGADSLLLKAEAAGGTAPYTYEWYCVPLSSTRAPGHSAALGAADAAFLNIYKAYDAKINSTAKELAKLYEDAEAVTPSDFPVEQIQKARSVLGRFSVLTRDAADAADEAEEGSESAAVYTKTFSAKTGNVEYYCVITDAAGRKVKTDPAQVMYNLYISEQPRNTNLYGADKAEISCTGAGGKYGHASDAFQYVWYDAEGKALSGGANRTVSISAPGEYYCLVSDGTQTAKTETVSVYKADPFRLSEKTASMELRSVKDVEINANFAGGTAPYNADWFLNGELISSKRSGKPAFTIKAGEFGLYTCVVTDGMGNTASSQTRISVKPMVIEEQPAGGTLSGKDREFVLKMTVSDGTAPYNYYLYRNGKVTDQTVSGSNKKSCSFTIKAPGEYQIIAEDHIGLKGFSDLAAVNDFESLYINNFTKEAGIGQDQSPAALLVRVNGGKAPYTYTWEKYSPDLYGWLTVSETVRTETTDLEYNYQYADDIDAYYYCRVEDSAGNSVYAGSMRAVYKGLLPYFTEHPQDVIVGSDSEVVLKAWAEPGNSADLPVQYRWQRVEGGRWVGCGTGNSIKLEGNIFGQYRCMASTDGFQTVTCSEPCSVSK